MNIDPQIIELNARQRADLAALSERVGKPWSVVFSEALSMYRLDRSAGIEPQESVLEAVACLGLVGCLHSGVTDLATNPIHMEGFGGDDY